MAIFLRLECFEMRACPRIRAKITFIKVVFQLADTLPKSIHVTAPVWWLLWQRTKPQMFQQKSVKLGFDRVHVS